MRKETNMNKKKNLEIYTTGIVGIIILFSIGMIYYNFRKPTDDRMYTSEISQLNDQTETQIVQNLEQASVNIGKTVEEVKEEIKEEPEKIAINTSIIEEKKINEDNAIKEEQNFKESDENQEEPKEELVFSMPVDGEIVKEFAKDTLLYSSTLNEWTTHSGIDIKAEKTTVVKSAEKGTVKYIKNDPRYGLTIVIEHIDGYSTVYSNLLTSEFVVEGEKVEKGQTIGTVGNTAIFEISDESHLHFEILKDNVQVDPNIYLK